MGLSPQYSKADVKRLIKEKIKNYLAALEARLTRAGEEFVTMARDGGGYNDRTGNLRASIGYVLMYNGRMKSSSFPGNSTGQASAKKIARKISSQYPKGFVLVCVAGMEYAAAVESRGKDVITGSAQIIEGTLRKALKRINRRASE